MRIVDLFSGVGGLTFGFYYKLLNGEFIKNDKCEIVFANEWNERAADAFLLNYPDIKMINKDIRNLAEVEIKNLIGDDEVQLIIGGPPCQSYSTIGKRKYDDKAQLYNQYLRLLTIIRPQMFLFENVKGMLSMKNEKGELIIDEIIHRFANVNEGLGYNIKHEVLDAVNYGVPQHRERVFIVGIRSDLDFEWQFPKGQYGKETPYITLKDAISDFPLVQPGENVYCYTSSPKNEYQKLMRNGSDTLTFHFAAIHGEKIQTVINHVIPGEGRHYINNLVDQGIIAEEYRLTSGYKNTYGRLIADQPSTTITNNMSTPSGLRCIHYLFNRALTPREGARIQSFPDWIQFDGNKENVTSQIGNAVPPLLALALARRIEEVFIGV